MRATTSPLEGNRMRLSVEVEESEISEALDATVKRLSSQVRIPGFRPGRVPRPVLEARMGGAEALRQQAIGDALPDLYATVKRLSSQVRIPGFRPGRVPRPVLEA